MTIMQTCPNGHQTSATDYCDVCGAPLPAASAPVDPAVAAERLARGEATPVATGGVQPGGPVASVNAATKACPSCQALNPGGALFCEACGYDFTTGSLPRPASPNPLDLDAPVAATPAAPEIVVDEVSPASPETQAPDAVLEPAPVIQTPEPAAVEPDPQPVAPVAELVADEAVEPVAAVAEPVAAVAEPVVPVAGQVAEPVAGAVGRGPEAPAAPRPAEWVGGVWIDPDWYAGQDSPDQLPSPGLPRIVGLRKRASLVGRPSRSRGISPDLDCEPDTGVSRRHAELTTDGTRWWVEDLGSSNGTYVGQAGQELPVDPITNRTELGPDARVYVGSWTRIVVRRADPDEADL